MTFRCRRVYLLVLLPLLAAFSLAANLSLFVHHKNEMVEMEQQLASAVMSSVFEDDDESSRPSPVVLSADAENKETVATDSIVSTLPKTTLTLNQEIRQQKRKRNRLWKQKKIPIIEPKPESLSSTAVFSACLLIKDDNEILDEWIAYHYHVLQLRRLVVAIDPRSVESPIRILDKWSNWTDMDIVDPWRDELYMPKEFLETGTTPNEHMQDASKFGPNISESDVMEISNHRYRQRVFLSECMKYLRDTGSTWIIHIDTDEYVVPSKLLREVQPDYINVISPDQPGAVLNLLQQVVEKYSILVTYPCVSMLRLLFGSVESSNEEIGEMVPDGFEARSFETLRWRYHAFPNNMTIHGNPKVIVDVSAIPNKFFPEIPYSIHRPVTEFCPRNKDLNYSSFHKQPIAVNHYLGSWERYNRKEDRRRSREKYNSKANVNYGIDDGIRPWLRGFADNVGHDIASKLLGEGHLQASK